MHRKQPFNAATETALGIAGFVGAMFDMWRRSQSKVPRLFAKPRHRPTRQPH